MNYCIIDENGIITNIIVCADDETAKSLGAVAGYPSAVIGDLYDPYNYYALDELKKKVNEQEILINTLTGVIE